MPRKTMPRLLSVAPSSGRFRLHVTFDTGETATIDLSDILGRFVVYAPLQLSPDLFRQVRLGDLGTDIVWTDDIDMSADTLHRLMREQAGQTMTASAFRSWREGRALSLDAAARALGISRRMIAYYEQGEKPIPRTVALATRGLDAA